MGGTWFREVSGDKSCICTAGLIAFKSELYADARDGPMDKLCSGYGLVEGPVWDQKCHALLYSDVLKGGVVVSGRNV